MEGKHGLQSLPRARSVVNVSVRRHAEATRVCKGMRVRVYSGKEENKEKAQRSVLPGAEEGYERLPPALYVSERSVCSTTN